MLLVYRQTGMSSLGQVVLGDDGSGCYYLARIEEDQSLWWCDKAITTPLQKTFKLGRSVSDKLDIAFVVTCLPVQLKFVDNVLTLEGEEISQFVERAIANFQSS